MTNKEKAVFDAAMCLYRSRRAYLKHSPHGLDCEGEYWIIRNTRPMKAFRKACAAIDAARKAKP